MDFDAVERLEVHAVGRADAIFINDLTGTDLKAADVDLSASADGGDAQPDAVITTGTDRADKDRVPRSGTRVLTSGLAAQTRIGDSKAANDTLAGNDDLDIDVAELIQAIVDVGADE